MCIAAPVSWEEFECDDQSSRLAPSGDFPPDPGPTRDVAKSPKLASRDPRCHAGRYASASLGERQSGLRLCGSRTVSSGVVVRLVEHCPCREAPRLVDSGVLGRDTVKERVNVPGRGPAVALTSPQRRPSTDPTTVTPALRAVRRRPGTASRPGPRGRSPDARPTPAQSRRCPRPPFRATRPR